MAVVNAAPGVGRPLVAVVCSVPLVGEAAGSALDFAEVRSFGGGRDTAGLLSWLRPDAVVVDSEEDAEAAQAFARDHVLSAVHIGVRDSTLRVLRRGEWELVGNGEGPTPEAIRNAVAGSLFSREDRLQ
jgi:hypothetical protein